MYTEKELSKLIEDVEKEFTSHLAKAEATAKLAKSEDGSTTPSVDGSEALAKAEEAKPAKAEDKEEKEAPKAEEKPADAKEGDKPAFAEAKPEGEEAAPAADAPPAEGGDHGYDEEDMAHMSQMYASMSRDELMAHHDAVKNALDACSAEETAEAPAAEAAPAAPAAPAEAPMVKSEEVSLLKTENLAKTAQIEELKKTLDAVSEFVSKLAAKKSAPAGKAITSLDVIAKSETANEDKELTKSEINVILNKKSADPALKKSDRDAINAFYLTNGSINSIRHLLK